MTVCQPTGTISKCTVFILSEKKQPAEAVFHSNNFRKLVELTSRSQVY